MDLWLFHIHTQGCSWDHPVSTAVLMVYLRLERGFHWRKTSLQLCERWPWKNQKLHVIYWLTNLLWSRVCRRVAADPIAAECLAVDNLSPIFYYLTVWMLRLCKYWVGIVHTVHKVDTNQLLSVLGTWKIKNQKSQCIAWFFRQGANSTPQGKFTLISSWSTQTFNNSWLAVEPLYWIRSGLSQRRGWQCCPGRPCSHARSCACQPTSKHITPVQQWQCIQIIWMLKFFTEQFRKSIFIILNAPDCVKSGRERLWYILTKMHSLHSSGLKLPGNSLHICAKLSLYVVGSEVEHYWWAIKDAVSLDEVPWCAIFKKMQNQNLPCQKWACGGEVTTTQTCGPCQNRVFSRKPCPVEVCDR